MQPLTIIKSEIIPFRIPFLKPFVFAGNTVTERVGYYYKLTSSSGLRAQGEVAPLPGLSPEGIKRAQHDIKEIGSYLTQAQFPTEKGLLFAQLRQEAHIFNLCASARFGVESALMDLAAQTQGKTLVEFLGGQARKVQSAILLQGTHDQVLIDAKRFKAPGPQVFKLKVGDRNISLDVKKVQDLRAAIDVDSRIRLDANRGWSLKEALLFAELTGLAAIEFIEEPLSEMAHLDQFYRQTLMPVALDETLAVVRCGINAPGRCSPTLAAQDGVKAYILKPMMLGGILATLDWMEEAKRLHKNVIISSSFESPVGLRILHDLACLRDEVAGLGTERWMKI